MALSGAPTRSLLPLNNALDLSAYTFDNPPDRYIDDPDGNLIQAQVVVDEAGTDELMITDHPVQRGAMISDHAVRRPCEVRMRMGWSNAYLADTGDGDVASMYEKILGLQARRQPFTVYTGKRVYENMLVASLQVHTDASLEYTFMADISFREVILVDTSVYTGGKLYSRAVTANREKFTPTRQGGDAQPLPANVPESQFADAQGQDIEQGTPGGLLLRTVALRPFATY